MWNPLRNSRVGAVLALSLATMPAGVGPASALAANANALLIGEPNVGMGTLPNCQVGLVLTSEG